MQGQGTAIPCVAGRAAGAARPLLQLAAQGIHQSHGTQPRAVLTEPQLTEATSLHIHHLKPPHYYRIILYLTRTYVEAEYRWLRVMIIEALTTTVVPSPRSNGAR